MNFLKQESYDDMKLKIRMGKLLLNILALRFVPTDPYWHSKKHCHCSFELHLIPYGKGTLYTNERQFEIIPGTFYLTGPGVYHEQISCPEDPMLEYCLNFEVIPLKREYKDTFENLTAYETDKMLEILQSNHFWFGVDYFDCISLFEKIYTELCAQRLGFYLSIKNYISQIILNTIRSFSMDSFTSYFLPMKTPDDSRRSRLDFIFGIRYSENLTPEKIASELNLSVRQINRVIKQFYSMSFTEKLLITRIENACALLEVTAYSVTDISEKLGFSTVSYFCKTFKKVKACTPKQYRNNIYRKL